MNKDETFTEKILNSPLFVVVLVSSYSIVSLFMVLFFDSFLAFEYFINTKFGIEVILVLILGSVQGIYNKCVPKVKYALLMFIYFCVLNSLFYISMITINTKVVNFTLILDLLKHGMLIIFPVALTLVFYIAACLHNLKNFTNELKTKSPLRTAFVITLAGTIAQITCLCLFSWLIEKDSIEIAGNILEFLFIAIDSLCALFYGFNYGLKQKKATSFKYLIKLLFALIFIYLVRWIFAYIFVFLTSFIVAFDFAGMIFDIPIDGLCVIFYFAIANYITYGIKKLLKGKQNE